MKYPINLLTIGSLKSPQFKTISEDYLKRLKQNFSIKQQVIKETYFKSETDKQRVLQIETKKIKERLMKDDFLIVLNADGKQFDSESFADFLPKWNENGTRKITFVIGGPLGLSAEIKKEANLLLSLSKMTMPHELSLIVFLEQLYRAGTILTGKTYHY